MWLRKQACSSSTYQARKTLEDTDDAEDAQEADNAEAAAVSARNQQVEIVKERDNHDDEIEDTPPV